MSVIYTHLTYEQYKHLEEQMRRFRETAHRTEGGFYHKSIRLHITPDLIMEFHGPMVGGYGQKEHAFATLQAQFTKSGGTIKEA